MYETFDHTADLGLRIEAADLNTLFAEAGLALTATLIENLEAVADVREVEVKLPADELEYLFFDWLKALLYEFDVHKLVLTRFRIEVGEGGLEATARGETFDPDRHEPAHEVKAITYHDLVVERTATGWRAEVIVDI